MKKIAIIGGPSTGKTTLIEGKGRTKGLVERLKRRGYKVGVVSDPARVYIEKWIRDKRSMMLADQLWILRDWLQGEQAAESQSPDFILCDGASFLAQNYCFLFKAKEVKARARQKGFEDEIFEAVMKDLPSYDYIFFLPMEFPPEKDGLRLWTDEAPQISSSIKTFLDTYLSQDPRCHEIRGNPKERIDKILKIILKSC